MCIRDSAKRERENVFLRYKSTSSNSVYKYRENLQFQSSFLRWIALHVPDRFVATFYVLKVRGYAYGAIKIGNEKKKRLQPLSVDRVRLW